MFVSTCTIHLPNVCSTTHISHLVITHQIAIEAIMPQLNLLKVRQCNQLPRTPENLYYPAVRQALSSRIGGTNAVAT